MPPVSTGYHCPSLETVPLENAAMEEYVNG